MEGVIRQVVESAGAGIAVPPGDAAALATAICALADDPQQARRMGYAGRQAIETDFDRAALALKLAELIEGMKRRENKK
jgi:glycosyltransferase involved in cell wall biosynthesis